MTAKEMFEELGYEKLEVANIIEYTDTLGRTIRFDKNMQSIEKFVNTPDYDDCHYTYGYLSLKELKAINKQAEELGWNKE